MIYGLYCWVIGRSGKWPALRKRFLSVYPTCAACGRADDLEVHHKVPYWIDPSRELDVSNLLTLCSRCHFVIGHLGDWTAWNEHCAEAAALCWAGLRTRKQPAA